MGILFLSGPIIGIILIFKRIKSKKAIIIRLLLFILAVILNQMTIGVTDLILGGWI